MKKVYFIICIFLFSINSLVAQKVKKIHIEKEKTGMYSLNASVNGIEGKFLYDRAASGLSFNKIFFDLLQKKGAISQSDYSGNAVVIGPNNKSINVEVYNIKSLVIDSIEIINTKAVLRPDSNNQLIIGANIFDKFSNVTVDTNNNIILLETNRIAIDEVKLIPCSIEKTKLLPNIVKHLKRIADLKTISEEQNVPPPVNALARIKDGITIRYFETETKEIAKLFKEELEKQSEYMNLDINIENMLPYIPSQIKGYLELWVK